MLGGDACGAEGKPEDQDGDLNLNDTRGLIPRSIEQIFTARDAALKAAEENRGVEPPSLAISATMIEICLLYTSPSPRDKRQSRMPSSA